MTTETINICKKKRSVLRASVSKIIKRLETELDKQETDRNEIEVLIEQLNDKFESLKCSDNELEKYVKIDDLEKEIESAEEYREKIVAIRFKAKKRLSDATKSDKGGPSPINTNEESKYFGKTRETTVKLPKITISKFLGEIGQWLSFWNSFETSIHNNESLDKVTKFNYLKSHLGGTALDTVEGFSISSDNYDKAITLLENRFGRKEILINEHMNNLLQITPLKRSNDVKGFRRLYDKCQTHIRSLESIGVKSETFEKLLCPLILRILPHDLVFQFHKECVEENYDINSLMNFLSQQLNARERTELSFSNNAVPKENINNLFPSPRQGATSLPTPRRTGADQNKNKIVTATDLFIAEVKPQYNLCVFCGKSNSHKSSACEFARTLTLEERKAVLLKKGACYNCLKTGHIFRNCKMKIICNICGKKHFDLMCYMGRDNLGKHDIKKETSNANKDETNENTVLTNSSCSKEVYLETLIVYIYENGVKRLIRIIIDTGSQRSYISKFIARKMKLKDIGEETVSHGLFGGIVNSEKHKRYLIHLSNLDEDFNCELEVMDQNKICASIPKIDDDQSIKELKALGIYVSDIEVNEKSCLYENDPNEIHLLVGADLAGKLLTGRVKHLFGGLVAIQTRLGWTVMGKAQGEGKLDSSLLVLSLHVNNAKIEDLWNLDTLGIKDLNEKRTKTETQELALKHFRETVSRDHTGRYQVCLPWLEGHPPLTTHEELAHKRLKNTIKSLKSTNKLKDYQEVFNEWEKEGVIEKIDPKNETAVENLGVHYLAHRAVCKENSTTKIRPVFDGSGKTHGSVSLNECLEKGPNLIELIPSILNRFRWGKIGVISDIRRAFLQISLHENDRNFLRFIWWKDGDPHQLVTYRHCRVVFGVSSSPFILAAVLTHLLNLVEEPRKDIAKKLKDSMYVDNCVASVDSTEELEYFRSESQKILSSAQFDLRGWINNDPTLRVSEENKVSVLGLSWNIREDTLSCELIDTGQEDEPVTKRRILSVTHRIFDPIGFTCPITLIPKLLLQECWKIEATWDSKLPEDIVKKFDKWKNQLPDLKNIMIPRRVSHLDLREADISLHVFCDASKLSYATCIFLRAEKNSEVTCQLLQARSRVAPLKGVSIPRLELLACNIGARLADSVKKDLNLEDIETFYWSDSMDVLYWIKRENDWVTFVSNRVNEIRNLSSTDCWKYVPGAQNAADLPSRGCSVKALMKGNWWDGPLWLRKSKDEWPDFKLSPDKEVVNKEKKKIIISSVNKENNEYYHRISSYKKIIRITGWIFRFYENIRSLNKKSGELSADELKTAELVILKKVQQESFHDEKDQHLKSLPTTVDVNGLIRVKSKAAMRDDEENFRFPIVLPTEHNVVKNLIICKHKEFGHSGVQYLMTALRENYWILKSRRAIKKVIKTCVTCQRFSLRPPNIPEGPLPEDRVKDTAVFNVIGVDVAGPLYIEDKKKAWILILTCAVYRAVHLELLTSLSTDNFLLALRRFIARRGRPSVIYSDNATNFVGAENFLKNINLEKLKTEIAPITWKFIPPYAPWWGGFWERLVGLMKQILRKVLGKSSLNYEEMVTVLCDAESILNSRPLTFVSDNCNDLDPITPAMFLQENSNSNILDLDQFDQLDRKGLSKRLKYRKRILQDLRTRFRLEYLGQLRQRNLKKTKVCDPKVGDIVLLWTESSKRINWPLGRILTIYPSKDGHIRMAKIKTKSGILIRPIRKLCFLELDEENVTSDNDCLPQDPVGAGPAEDTIVCPPPMITRTGRVVRVPVRYQK